MQTADNGEYIPSKELDKTFRIPKRKPNATPILPDQYPAAPVFDEDARMEETRQLILQNLQQKSALEKPKTYANHILRETIPDCYDVSLPRELTALFQPLYCKLCAAQLSSNIVAKLHYKSKNHEKKIRKFLVEYSERTGEPLHKRARLTGAAKDAADSNPLYFYCDVCDLPLTGKLHAESHYMGKNHRKATLGVKQPAGKGHYDSEGKWIRDGPVRNKRPDTCDTFGMDFYQQQQQQSPSSCGVVDPPIIMSSAFRCDLCNITTTCREQLESHYIGQKHRKKLKQQQQQQQLLVEPSSSSHLTDDSFSAVAVDCSVYRTPSGQYYCPICNTTMNSELQFKQHLQSKNHLKKSLQKQT